MPSPSAPVVHLLDLLYARGRADTSEVAWELRLWGSPHVATVRRSLTTLRRLGIVRATKFRAAPVGRPRLRWKVTEKGARFLQLTGRQSERYRLRWPEVAALAKAVEILSRLGHFKRMERPKGPAWLKNRWLSA